MKTSIIGYPRIGARRELKFASERYFKGEISEAELNDAAKAVRLAGLRAQKDSGLDCIPSGGKTWLRSLKVCELHYDGEGRIVTVEAETPDRNSWQG